MSILKFEIGPLSTNCYLYIDDKTGEAVVIDPAFPTEKLIENIKKVNLKYILLTHAHADHIMSVSKIKELTSAKTVAHKCEEKRLLGDESNLYEALGCYDMPYASQNVDVFVDDGDVIEFGTKIITVLHTPGHTDGSVCYMSENFIFCGDTVFAGSYGRTDFKSGSYSDLIDSFHKLFCLQGDYLLYPGHQGSTTLNDERNFNPLSRYV